MFFNEALKKQDDDDDKVLLRTKQKHQDYSSPSFRTLRTEKKHQKFLIFIKETRKVDLAKHRISKKVFAIEVPKYIICNHQ